MELVRLAVVFIVKGDQNAAIQKRQLAQPLRQDVEAEDGGLEDQMIGLERDLGAAAFGGAGYFQIGGRHASHIALLIGLAVAPDFEVERFREGVDDRDADAVQPTRDFVAVVVELAAGVQHREHDLGGRLAAGVAIDRNAASVVDDGDRAIDVEGHVDLIAEPRQRFVYGVVDDLVDQMVQAGRTGRADVHRRPFLHGLEPLEHSDLVGRIFVDLGGRALAVVLDGRVRRLNRRVFLWCLFLIELCHSAFPALKLTIF